LSYSAEFLNIALLLRNGIFPLKTISMERKARNKPSVRCELCKAWADRFIAEVSTALWSTRNCETSIQCCCEDLPRKFLL